MKLNGLLKYNSLKLFSLYGYLFAVYYYIYRLSVIHLLNKEPNMDSEVAFFAFKLFVARDYLIGICLVFLIIIIELIYRKLKKKNAAVKLYPIFGIIAFWTGIIFALTPFIMMFWFWLSDFLK